MAERIVCPNCGSLRIAGTKRHFNCKNCGFNHHTPKSVPTTLLIQEIGKPKEAKN